MLSDSPPVIAVFRLTATRVGAVVHLVAAVALCFFGLFDVLGFERAFVAGLIAAPVSAAIGLSAVRRARQRRGADLARLFGHASAAGIVLLLPTVIAGGIVEWIEQPCDPGEGLVFVLACAGVSAVFGAALGTSLGTLTTRRILPGLTVAAALIGNIAWCVHRLYAEPQIFVYSMPFGYWPGSLYDEDVTVTTALLAHRGLTLLVALALVFAARAFTDDQSLLAFRSRLRPASLAGAVALMVAAWTLHGRGDALGFDRTRASIDRALSRHHTDEGFEVRADPSIPSERMDDFAIDAAVRYAQLTEFFDRKPDEPIRIYLYRDVSQKHALMGASHTQIARPWANEIHIHGFEVPHRVLKHELAHIFAARWASGVFRVPAAAGVLVNLGIVEGVAVAADWPARRGLTIHEWTRAMRALGLAPDPRTALYPAGFWSISSSRAYTTAGSLVRFLYDQYGRERLATLYATNDFDAAYGKSLDALTGEWEVYIDALPLAKDALPVAEHRFKQPGVFQKVCAHTTASLARRGRALLASGDLAGGAALLERVAGYRPGSVDEHLAIAEAYARHSDAAAARAQLQRTVAQPNLSAPNERRVRTAIADLDWKAGRVAEARAAYEDLRLGTLPASDERLLIAKLAALGRSPELQSTLQMYLTGGLSQPRALVRLSDAIEAHPEDGLLRYLFARQLDAIGEPDRGLAQIQRALQLGLPAPLFEDEAHQMIGRMLYRAKRYAEAQAHFEARAKGSATAADALFASDWAHRAAIALSRTSTSGIEVDRTPFGR